MDQGALSYAPRLLDAGEVAAVLGLTGKRAVYNRRHRGTLPPAIKVGSSVRWRADTLDAWLDAQADGGDEA